MLNWRSSLTDASGTDAHVIMCAQRHDRSDRDQKIQRNVRRRVRVTEDLSSAGWAVIAIRECEVRENLDACLRYVLMSMRARATEARTS